jgi:hypothetical protein
VCVCWSWTCRFVVAEVVANVPVRGPQWTWCHALWRGWGRSSTACTVSPLLLAPPPWLACPIADLSPPAVQQVLEGAGPRHLGHVVGLGGGAPAAPCPTNLQPHPLVCAIVQDVA